MALNLPVDSVQPVTSTPTTANQCFTSTPYLQTQRWASHRRGITEGLTKTYLIASHNEAKEVVPTTVCTMKPTFPYFSMIPFNDLSSFLSPSCCCGGDIEAVCSFCSLDCLCSVCFVTALLIKCPIGTVDVCLRTLVNKPRGLGWRSNKQHRRDDVTLLLWSRNDGSRRRIISTWQNTKARFDHFSWKHAERTEARNENSAPTDYLFMDMA